MAEKAKKDNKNLIIGICVAVLAIAVIVVAVVLATKGTTKLSDAYFKSDDTKYVLTIDEDQMDTEDAGEYEPVKTHIVYYYSGDTINGMTTYMEFADEATAKTALEAYKSVDQEGVKSLSANGKYLVIEMTEDQYSDLTTSDVKQQIEFMEMLKNMDSDDTDSVEEVDAEEVEE